MGIKLIRIMLLYDVVKSNGCGVSIDHFASDHFASQRMLSSDNRSVQSIAPLTPRAIIRLNTQVE